MHNQNIRYATNHSDRNKIFNGVKADIFVQCRINRLRTVDGHQQRIAVRGSRFGLNRTNIATRPGFIHQHDRLLEFFGKF